MGKVWKWALLALVIVLVEVVVTACVYGTALEASHHPGQAEYPADQQRLAAQRVVAGLNSRDANRLGLIKHARDITEPTAENVELDKRIAAAMPAPGCTLRLMSMKDRGVQPTTIIHQLPLPAYRFDVRVTEHCPDRPPRDRVIGVLAVPGQGGYWESASVIVEN
ncbi:hypothetical protein FZI91_07870 [Mycobacterium sp. CBMA271]|uniref:hypothetical protein n=1 Tax=unclassified Mycobacteroides TaxID=2618759 RepID=UPI0012DCA22D|nr:MULTISPECIES: hypothetical protein [unclassified Mycobacteroides]MUM19208.1 hypothetical protein [Mycobacteroides sp. CBMA 326]MUM21622.1 hypothetical protein [Mycobacteroides sp. CBMA 271]